MKNIFNKKSQNRALKGFFVGVFLLAFAIPVFGHAEESPEAKRVGWFKTLKRYEVPSDTDKVRSNVTSTGNFDPSSEGTNEPSYSSPSPIVVDRGRCIVSGGDVRVDTRLAFSKCPEVDIPQPGSVTLIAGAAEYLTVYKSPTQDPDLFDYRVEDWNAAIQEKAIFYITGTDDKHLAINARNVIYPASSSVSTGKAYPDPTLAPVPHDICDDQCSGSSNYEECHEECLQTISNIVRSYTDSRLNRVRNLPPTKRTFQYLDPNLVVSPDCYERCGDTPDFECSNQCLIEQLIKNLRG